MSSDISVIVNESMLSVIKGVPVPSETKGRERER
jgi:hypothetical protein